MAAEEALRDEMLQRLEAIPGVAAGVAELARVLDGPSHRSGASEPQVAGGGKPVERLPGMRSVVVVGLHHPGAEPEMDWWHKGDCDGNRRLRGICRELAAWLEEKGRPAQALPYYVQDGGVFLKDAATLAGLGRIGRHNLFLHPKWGSRIRLRALLTRAELPSKEPRAEFDPCARCKSPCRAACPQEAFAQGSYLREACLIQLGRDAEEARALAEANGDKGRVIKFCRACELACPVGKRAG